MSDEPSYDVVWPLGPKASAGEPLGDRLEDLNGMVIAELWDYLYRGDDAYPLLRDALRARFPGAAFVEYPVFGNIHGADELEIVDRLPALLAEHGVDAVICGVGHCGSCTAATIRASVAAERAGYPTVSVVGSAFEKQANLLARMFGMEGLPLAVYPGRIPMDSDEQFAEKITTTITDQVVAGFTGSMPSHVAPATQPTPHETVFSGSIGPVNDHFDLQGWSDGLPVVPPTTDAVQAFMAFTDREPAEVLGVLQPEFREATVWSVAVNGVMAGCRPEYMPVLVAAVQAIAEPSFRLPDSASGAAWEPLITVSGPIIEQLGFNYGIGAQRLGRRSNSSIGRFLRLYMRNVAGLRPGETERGGIGQNFHVVLAEDEGAIGKIGWPTAGDDDGVPEGCSGVTVQSVFAASTPMGEYEDGGDSDNPYTYLRPIVEYFAKGTASYWLFTGLTYGGFHPLLILSPHCARVLAAHGWSKDDVRRHLYEESRVPARATLGRGLYTGLDLENMVATGKIGEDFLRSRDPDRLIPSFLSPESIRIVVAGNPDMYWQRGYISNHTHGQPTTKVIEPPAGYEELLAGSPGYTRSAASS